MKIFMRKMVALFCLAAAVMCLASCASAAGIEERVMNAWSKRSEFSDGDGAQFLQIRVTYYSAEYIEALVRSEAEKNLWTNDELENYKYNLLKTLNLDETIAFHIEFDVTGLPLYLAPFDRHLKLYAGRKVLEPVEYDMMQFNRKILGEKRDGMVKFPRYDPDTGKNNLEGVREVRLLISGAMSQATTGTGDVRFIWNIADDDPSVLNAGTAAARLELDRLIKRLDKLRADQQALQEQLNAINAEADTVDARVDELQRQ